MTDKEFKDFVKESGWIENHPRYFKKRTFNLFLHEDGVEIKQTLVGYPRLTEQVRFKGIIRSKTNFNMLMRMLEIK